MSDRPMKVRHKQFEYSPLVQGVYRGLLWAVLPMPLVGIDVFVAYVLILIFLGFGLRPVLERTGLYRLLNHYLVVFEEKSSRRFMEKRAAEIDRKARDEKYRKRRLKHPDLPKNW